MSMDTAWRGGKIMGSMLGALPKGGQGHSRREAPLCKVKEVRSEPPGSVMHPEIKIKIKVNWRAQLAATRSGAPEGHASPVEVGEVRGGRGGIGAWWRNVAVDGGGGGGKRAIPLYHGLLTAPHGAGTHSIEGKKW